MQIYNIQNVYKHMYMGVYLYITYVYTLYVYMYMNRYVYIPTHI